MAFPSLLSSTHRHDAITCTMMRKLNNNSRIIRRSKRSSPSSTRIVIRTIFLLGSYLYLCNGTPHSATAYRRSDPFDYSGGSSKSTSAFFRNKALTSCIIGAAWYSFSCLQIVTSGDECLVERFGKFVSRELSCCFLFISMCINLHSSLPLQHRKLSPGWHFVFKPFECVSFHVTTREQVLDVPPQQVCKHEHII